MTTVAEKHSMQGAILDTKSGEFSNDMNEVVDLIYGLVCLKTGLKALDGKIPHSSGEMNDTTKDNFFVECKNFTPLKPNSANSMTLTLDSLNQMAPDREITDEESPKNTPINSEILMELAEVIDRVHDGRDPESPNSPGACCNIIFGERDAQDMEMAEVSKPNKKAMTKSKTKTPKTVKTLHAAPKCHQIGKTRKHCPCKTGHALLRSKPEQPRAARKHVIK